MDLENFICPVCGCDGYDSKVFGSLQPWVVYSCRKCTTLFWDPTKFTSVRISRGVPLTPPEVEALLQMCGGGDAKEKLFIALLTGIQTTFSQLLEALKQMSDQEVSLGPKKI